MFTRFMDMYSGGGCKEKPYEYIYIEAPRPEAEIIFYNRFHHSPSRVSCTCCGEDYSVDDYETLAEATAYERNDYPNSYPTSRLVLTLEEYLQRSDVLVIRAEDILPTERVGYVPEQGYVWQD